jgi:hypothetical protein
LSLTQWSTYRFRAAIKRFLPAERGVTPILLFISWACFSLGLLRIFGKTTGAIWGLSALIVVFTIGGALGLPLARSFGVREPKRVNVFILGGCLLYLLLNLLGMLLAAVALIAA